MFYVIQQPTTYNYPFFSPKWFGDLDEEKRASSTMSKCKWVVRGVSTAPIRMHYSTLPKIVVVYKLFHLSNSFYLIFFLVLLLLHFFFSEVFHSFLHPPKHLLIALYNNLCASTKPSNKAQWLISAKSHRSKPELSLVPHNCHKRIVPAN